MRPSGPTWSGHSAGGTVGGGDNLITHFFQRDKTSLFVDIRIDRGVFNVLLNAIEDLPLQTLGRVLSSTLTANNCSSDVSTWLREECTLTSGRFKRPVYLRTQPEPLGGLRSSTAGGSKYCHSRQPQARETCLPLGTTCMFHSTTQQLQSVCLIRVNALRNSS